MVFLLLTLVVLAAIYGPFFWTKRILAKYNKKEYLSNTGLEIARLLISEHNLTNIGIEETSIGDHYDPVDKKVRLSPDTFNKKSLSAVVSAAHEVGHAIQDSIGYKPFRLRTSFAEFAAKAAKVGAGLILVVPIITIIFRAPRAGLLMFIGGFVVLGLPVLLHLVTLPVEFDASFNKAIRMLEKGNYVPVEDLPAARTILFACAMTYVAAALADLLNIWRWIRILRR